MILAGEVESAGLPRYNDDYFGYVAPGRGWHKTPLLESTPGNNGTGTNDWMLVLETDESMEESRT